MSLVLNIAMPIIIACVVNAIIYSMKWNQPNSEQGYKGLPPGWVIGSIWIVILGLLGYCRWLLRGNRMAVASVTFLIIFCVLYPFYTLGLRENIGRVMNLVTLILAFSIAIIVARADMRVIIYFIPLLVWASYVNFAQTI